MNKVIEEKLLEMIASEDINLKDAQVAIVEALAELLIEAAKGTVALGLLHMLDHDGYDCARNIRNDIVQKFAEHCDAAMQEWCNITGQKNPYFDKVGDGVNDKLRRELMEALNNES